MEGRPSATVGISALVCFWGRQIYTLSEVLGTVLVRKIEEHAWMRRQKRKVRLCTAEKAPASSDVKFISRQHLKKLPAYLATTFQLGLKETAKIMDPTILDTSDATLCAMCRHFTSNASKQRSEALSAHSDPYGLSQVCIQPLPALTQLCAPMGQCISF
jgi:hypothetical protein